MVDSDRGAVIFKDEVLTDIQGGGSAVAIFVGDGGLQRDEIISLERATFVVIAWVLVLNGAALIKRDVAVLIDRDSKGNVTTWSTDATFNDTILHVEVDGLFAMRVDQARLVALAGDIQFVLDRTQTISARIKVEDLGEVLGGVVAQVALVNGQRGSPVVDSDRGAVIFKDQVLTDIQGGGGAVAILIGDSGLQRDEIISLKRATLIVIALIAVFDSATLVEFDVTVFVYGHGKGNWSALIANTAFDDTAIHDENDIFTAPGVVQARIGPCLSDAKLVDDGLSAVSARIKVEGYREVLACVVV